MRSPLSRLRIEGNARSPLPTSSFLPSSLNKAAFFLQSALLSQSTRWLWTACPTTSVFLLYHQIRWKEMPVISPDQWLPLLIVISASSLSFATGRMQHMHANGAPGHEQHGTLHGISVKQSSSSLSLGRPTPQALQYHPGWELNQIQHLGSMLALQGNPMWFLANSVCNQNHGKELSLWSKVSLYLTAQKPARKAQTKSLLQTNRNRRRLGPGRWRVTNGENNWCQKPS